MNIVYYVNGHGHGHARRSSEILRALAHSCPSAHLHVRTSASPALFSTLPVSCSKPAISFDAGALEKDVLTIDLPATLRHLEQISELTEKIVDAELQFLDRQGCDLILCDVPSICGKLSAQSGVPVAGISNFTWDWIYEPMLSQSGRGRELLDRIARHYQKFDLFIQLPFGPRTRYGQRLATAGLIPQAQQAASREALVAELNLSKETTNRPFILVGLRSGVSPAQLAAAAQSAPDYVFFHPESVPATTVSAPENLVSLPAPEHFLQLMSVADVVVAKLGFGVLSDCIARRTSLLYPPRSGFREDLITEKEAPHYLSMRRVSTAAFFQGDWGKDLHKLMEQPWPDQTLPVDGAADVVKILSQQYPSLLPAADRPPKDSAPAEPPPLPKNT